MLTPLVESPVGNGARDAAVCAPHGGPARRPSIAEGEPIGSYELVELMGRGGMGEVWRARHRRLARGAAIKFVRPERLGGGGHEDAMRTMHQFEREAQATASLSSPYTIRLFDFGTTGEGAFYYAMELLEGRDLDTLVREFGPLPAARVVYLLEQICHSLADAHACGLVHGDIKPANIHACRMGLEYDFVKVLDFGLVKREDRALEDTLVTAQQITSGTPGYMAPEAILGDGHVDRRADIYALGCVAYFLLTGQPVFDAVSPIQRLLQHLQADPVPPSQRTGLPIPGWIDDLVLACLQRDPSRRPQDADEVLRLIADSIGEDAWTPRLAKEWWEEHLPELTGPVTAARSDAGAPGSLAVQ